MKIADPNFPLAELLELISESGTTTNATVAPDFARRLATGLMIRDQSGANREILFISPRTAEQISITVRNPDGGSWTTNFTLQELRECIAAKINA